MKIKKLGIMKIIKRQKGDSLINQKNFVTGTPAERKYRNKVTDRVLKSKKKILPNARL